MGMLPPVIEDEGGVEVRVEDWYRFVFEGGGLCASEGITGPGKRSGFPYEFRQCSYSIVRA